MISPIRVRDEAGKRQTSPLPGRKPAHLQSQLARQPKAVGRRQGRGLVRTAPARLEQQFFPRRASRLQTIQVTQQMAVAPTRLAGIGRTLEDDLPGGGAQQAGDGAQEAGLARPVGPHDRQGLAGGDVRRQTGE